MSDYEILSATHAIIASIYPELVKLDLLGCIPRLRPNIYEILYKDGSKTADEIKQYNNHTFCVCGHMFTILTTALK